MIGISLSARIFTMYGDFFSYTNRAHTPPLPWEQEIIGKLDFYPLYSDMKFWYFLKKIKIPLFLLLI